MTARRLSRLATDQKSRKRSGCPKLASFETKTAVTEEGQDLQQPWSGRYGFFPYLGLLRIQ